MLYAAMAAGDVLFGNELVVSQSPSTLKKMGKEHASQYLGEHLLDHGMNTQIHCQLLRCLTEYAHTTVSDMDLTTYCNLVLIN